MKTVKAYCLNLTVDLVLKTSFGTLEVDKINPFAAKARLASRKSMWLETVLT